MVRAPLLLSLALAGCLGDTDPGMIVAPVDAPELAEILPAAAEIPPGFSVGWQEPVRAGGGSAGASRVYDHDDENVSTHHTLQLGVIRFPSVREAEMAFEGFAAAPQGGRPSEIEPGLLVTQTVEGSLEEPARFSRQVHAIGHRSVYLAWVVESARGGDVLTSPLDLVRGMLDRAAAEATGRE